MNNRVGLEFDDLFEFVAESKNTSDYIRRLEKFAMILLLEFDSRIPRDKVISTFETERLITEMNNEVILLAEQINSSNLFVGDQPPIQYNVFLDLLALHHPSIIQAYNYVNVTHKN